MFRIPNPANHRAEPCPESTMTETMIRARSMELKWQRFWWGSWKWQISWQRDLLVFVWVQFWEYVVVLLETMTVVRLFLTRIKFESYGVLVADLLQDVDGHVEVVVLHRWRRVDRGKRWPIDKHQNCQEICNCTHTISWNTRSRASYYYFIYEHQHHTSLSVVLFLTRYRSWTCCWSPCGRDHDTRRRWTLPDSENGEK